MSDPLEMQAAVTSIGCRGANSGPEQAVSVLAVSSPRRGVLDDCQSSGPF